MKAAAAIDYRELARRRLPKFLFEYVDGGSCSELTLRRNFTDLEGIVLRQVTRSTGQSIWFQRYVIRDRAFMRGLVAQAQEAKCSALVFTVDMPVPGSRYRDYRSGLAGAPGRRGAVRRALTGATTLAAIDSSVLVAKLQNITNRGRFE